jgi:rubrerythrin
MKEVYTGGYNHVCEDCGHQWESSKEIQKCPNCGSVSEGNQQG